MKFQITIKEQSEAINGKAKYPLYKATNQKTFDVDRGLEALQELIESSSIKIFCDECEKEITFETIVIAYEGDLKLEFDKQRSEDLQKQNLINEEKILYMDKEKQKKNAVQQKLSKVQASKRIHKKKLEDEIFQEKDSSSQEDEEIGSDSEQIQFQQSHHRNPLQSRNNHPIQSRFDSKDKAAQVEAQTSREVTHLYCVGCFACLQEFPPFYSIRKSLKFSPSNSSWTVFDEINLLNGLKFWGFGNWGQIKEFMDYNSSLFTVKQIEEHYEELYLKGDGPTFPRTEEFDMRMVRKPGKKIFEEMMHEYYFAPKSEETLHIEIQTLKESLCQNGNGIADINWEMHRGDSQRRSSMRHSSKHFLGGNNFLADSIHTSNTSFYNLKEERQKNGKAIDENIRMDECSDEQFSEESEEQQMKEGNLQEIQLKPRPSNQIYEGKISGKGLKQGLFRSGHPFSESPKSNEHGFSVVHRNQSALKSTCLNKLKGQNVYSYNPKRKEFEIIEYDYYAESMIAQLEFLSEDTEEEINLKIKLIEEYNHRLDQRIKRREFVIEHRLLDTDFMVKILSKYSRPNFQIFQPFRRLISKHEDYYHVLESYGRMCKANSLAQGIIKINKKLKSKHKRPQLKHFVDYLNQKKEKKELLGKRARYQNQSQRRILLKQGAKGNKKIIVSMSQHSHSYINSSSPFQIQALSPSNHHQPGLRTMTSRSEERQKLRVQNQSAFPEQQKSGAQQPTNENINFSNLNTANQSLNFMNGSSTGLFSILSQQDIDTIERFVKKQAITNVIQNFKPLTLKSYTLKPLNLQTKFKF